MFDLQEMIKYSKIHHSRIFNVYIFGSHVYGVATDKSDIDVIIVANNSVEAIEIKSELYNIHVYTPKKFQEDLDWCSIKNLECMFLDNKFILQEKIKFEFNIDLKKLRHAISHISSNSYVKCHKKLTIEPNDSNYYIGIKSLYHSLRIPMFGKQIAESGKIHDYTIANAFFNDLFSRKWTSEELKEKYKSIHNEIMSEFRKVASKD